MLGVRLSSQPEYWLVIQREGPVGGKQHHKWAARWLPKSERDVGLGGLHSLLGEAAVRPRALAGMPHRFTGSAVPLHLLM